MSFDDEHLDHDVGLCDCSACENRRAALATRPLVSCKRCGRNFDAPDWERAELVGYQPDGAGGLLELRNCPCGSTHSVELQAEDARYPRALLSAIERVLVMRPGLSISMRADGKVVYVEVQDKRRGVSQCVGENLEDALQACLESSPPATKPHDELLFRLVTGREPARSSELDVRPEDAP